MNIPNLRISKKTELSIFTWLVVLIHLDILPNFIRSLISLATYGFIFLVTINRLPRLTYVAFKDIFLLSLVFLAIFSLIWSESPDSTLSALRFSLRSTFFALYLGVEYTPKDLIRFLTRICIILMILSLISVLLLPGYSLMLSETGVLSWRGVFNHKQVFGPFMGITCSIFLGNCFYKTHNRWLSLFWLGCSFVMLVLSNSRTGLLMFLLSLYMMPIYKVIRQGKHRDFMLFIMLTIYVGIGVLLAINLETIVESLGKNLEFNGRTPIWELAINSGLKQPWLGYGYNGFWTSKASDYVLSHTWASGSENFRDRTVSFIAHNGYIDLFLQLGIVGLLLFCISQLIGLKRIIYLMLSTRKPEYFWYFIFIIINTLNILQAALPLSKEFAWFVYSGITFSSAIEYYRIRKIKQEIKLIM